MSRPSLFRPASATATIVVSTILGLVQAGALPRQTSATEHGRPDLVSWPLAPTAAPQLSYGLLRRQDFNTICGYIGGDSALPATCSAGSHCVLDTGHGFVGCCPDSGPCTEGVYTGCVDVNSPPQTVVDPYIYTCQGSDVCYRNQFAGGFNQYGCGTASNLGTTVQTSIQGVTTALDLPSFTVPFTQDASSLPVPTTIGSASSRPGSSTESSSRTSSTRQSSLATSSKSTSASPTTTDQSASESATSATNSGTGEAVTSPTEQPTAEHSDNKNAVIIGATLGSVAGIALLAVAAFLLMKHRKNKRQGPGQAPPGPDTRFISPMGHGAAFAPLPTWSDEDQYQHGQDYPRRSSESQLPMVPPPLQQHPAFHQQPMLSVGTGLTPVVEEGHEDYYTDSHSTRGREIDDFSRAYSSAGIGETSSQEDSERGPLAAALNAIGSNPYSSTSDQGHLGSDSDDQGRPERPKRGGSGPLWQQNRQQSRNMMWM